MVLILTKPNGFKLDFCSVIGYDSISVYTRKLRQIPWKNVLFQWRECNIIEPVASLFSFHHTENHIFIFFYLLEISFAWNCIKGNLYLFFHFFS